MINNTLPFISCVCVTRGKPKLLQRAISCFEAQTYLNKELIIVYEEDDLPTRQFVEANRFNPAVKIIEISINPKRKLGNLRNIAIREASGTYICQWDDDDWYHIQRLEHQYQLLHKSGYQASVMTQWLIFDNTRGDAYISNKRRWEGSILCRKDVLQLKQYEETAKGEDTVVIEYLHSKNYIYEIKNHVALYIYIYHGGNTWDLTHWENIFRHSDKLSAEQAGKIGEILNGAYTVEEGSFLIDHLLNADRYLSLQV